MSQRSVGRRDRRRARAQCRENRHRYGSAAPIGAGITRRVCLACGAVSIDLTGAEPPAPTDVTASPGSFRRREGLSSIVRR